MTFLTNLGVTRISCSFKVVLEGKAGKVVPESSRLVFLEESLANTFALSDTEHITSVSLNRACTPHVKRAKFLRTARLFFYQHK